MGPRIHREEDTPVVMIGILESDGFNLIYSPPYSAYLSAGSLA